MKEKPELLTQMSSVVAHEIRNPLAIISNSLYFIKTKLSAGGAAPDPKVAKHLGIIEGEVKHANDVIEEILAFTRARELKRAPASANAALRDLAESYPVPPTVTLKVAADPADPRVNADMDAIGYALRCVLTNAVQALPEGGLVILECSHDAGLVHLTCTDTGPGFPGGDGEKAFEPFFTTKPRGIGLGLTIARKLLARQGGTVKAENASGRGARVTVSLPGY
ncbi:MAG TPA: hypothetical protein DCS63_06895 [Elusimicrobia bacterium]|nr:hypothetical protein [Elusimicrobiota bacterium]